MSDLMTGENHQELTRYPSTVGYIKARYPNYVFQDGVEDLVVSVEPEDVERSSVGDARNCAFACAIRRIFGENHTEAIVTKTLCVIVDHHNHVATRFRSDKIISAMVDRFDNTGKIPSGEYRFHKIQDPVVKQRTGSTRTRTRVNKPQTQPRTPNTNYRHWIGGVSQTNT